MLPPKESPSQRKDHRAMNMTNKDILDLVDGGSTEDNVSAAHEEAAGESMISTCSDMGYKSQDDIYLFDSYTDVFERITQPLSVEQNSSDTDTIFDVDVSSDRADDTESYGSILTQFDTFFRSKLNAELQAFQESMHALLTEQQIHIQRIISSSIEPSLSEGFIQEVDAGSAESCEDSLNASDAKCMCPDSENKAKMALIMELLSLSCQVTTLLNLPKFAS